MDLERGSRNSKHKEIVLGGTGRSKHTEVHSKVIDGSGGSRHAEMRSKVRDGSDTNKYHSPILREATANEGSLRVPSRKLISLSSSSSVASDVLLEDLFQVDTNRITPSTHNTAGLPKPHDYSSLDRSSTSRLSDVTPGLMMHGMSPTESPAIQMMERSGGYDPCRIPSSVFVRSKSNKEMEWSVASNESLFSIHLGNNSFSRDHIFILGDLGKPGELSKSGELFTPSPPPPPVPEVEIETPSFEEVRISGAEGGVAVETTKDAARTNAEDHSKGRVPPPTVPFKSPTFSRHSDGSGTSTRSFAFPIANVPVHKQGGWGKRACPLCYCSNCSRAFCFGTCPSCKCSNCSRAFCYGKWPSCYCSNCSLAFCYPWNCSRTFCCHWNCSRAFCCHWNCSRVSCCYWNCSRASCCHWNCNKKRMRRDDFPTALTDGMKNSVEVTQFTEEKCTESPAAAAAAKVSNKKVTKPKSTYWLSCFSWCKWGCSCSRRSSCASCSSSGSSCSSCSSCCCC